MKQTLKISFLLLALLMPMMSHAYDFSVDGIYYSINNDEATVTSGNTYYSGDVVIPETVTVNGLTYTVTAIGEKAFYRSRELTNIDIPQSVTSIGRYAFWDCEKLSNITIGSTITSIGDLAFSNCRSLTSIEIPCSVTSIGIGVFRDCPNLASISVSSDNTFYDSRNGCNAIIETVSNKLITGCKNTVIPNSVTAIGNSAFGGCTLLTDISIPNSVTVIGNFAFRGCTSLTSMSIPNSVTVIGNHAFQSCTSLTSMSIPHSVIVIGDSAFEFCTGMTSVTIPNSVTTIYPCAFASCISLTSITIPNSVSHIGSCAFQYCTELTSVTISDSVTYIGSRAFDHTAWYDNLPDGLIYIGLVAYKYKGTMPEETEISIKEGTVSISDMAFRYCDGLTSISIPKSVTDISSDLGYSNGLTSIIVDPSNPKYDSRENCNAVIETVSNTLVSGCKSTIIPNSVTVIGNSAFGCRLGLTSVTIPNSVKSIEYCAFHGCYDLTSVKIGSGVTSINGWSFLECTQLTSIVVENANPKFDSRDNCNAIIETATNSLYLGCKNTVIPSSVTSVGNGAFEFCTGLTSIEIPGSVSSIGNYAFSGCISLVNVMCQAVTPPTMGGDRVFSDYSSPTLYVPEQSIALYQTTDYWNQFTTILPIEVETEPDRFHIEDFTIRPGETVTVSIMLENEAEYTAFQSDLFLPDGLTMEQEDGDYIFDLTGRKARDHNIASQSQPDGSIRLMSYSPRINAYSGNSGALVTFDVTADADMKGPATIVLRNTLFTTTAGQEIALDDEQCTVTVHTPGDVDGNGVIGMDDLSLLINILLTSNEYSPGADVDGNGVVGMDDLSLLINMLLTS